MFKVIYDRPMVADLRKIKVQNPEHHQKLIIYSLAHNQYFQKIL